MGVTAAGTELVVLATAGAGAGARMARGSEIPGAADETIFVALGLGAAEVTDEVLPVAALVALLAEAIDLGAFFAGVTAFGVVDFLGGGAAPLFRRGSKAVAAWFIAAGMYLFLDLVR